VKAKVEAAPAPGMDKNKTAAAKTPPPPPGPKESQPERGPLEDNLDLQKEIMDLAPKFPAISIK